MRIIVEGSSDVNFLQQYILTVFKIELLQDSFIIVNGNDPATLIPIALELVVQAQNEGESQFAFILDADGDYTATRNNVLHLLQAKGFDDTHLFLFPNNNGVGNLETAVVSTIVEPKKTFFTCFDGFKECLTANGFPEYPSEKAKLYAYREIHATRKERKNASKYLLEEVCTYKPELFDFNSPGLEKLKEFLTPYFAQ